MADKIIEEIGMFFEHPQRSEKVLRFKPPGGFETQVLAQEHLVGIAFECPRIHKMTVFYVRTAMPEVIQPLDDSRRIPGTFEDHIGAQILRRVFPDARPAEI